MREGDLVRIRPSPRLMAPWQGYARNGILVRVHRLSLAHDGASKAKVVDPLSNRAEWIDGEDLIPQQRHLRAGLSWPLTIEAD